MSYVYALLLSLFKGSFVNPEKDKFVFTFYTFATSNLGGSLSDYVSIWWSLIPIFKGHELYDHFKIR